MATRVKRQAAQQAGAFSHQHDALRQLVTDALGYSRTQGATACEADVSERFGLTVTVRRGEVETIEYNRDKSLGISVYLGKRRGHASTSDFAPQAIRAAAGAALSIARFTAADDFAGLADEDLLARQIPDL